jgi:hypothetical protein
MMIASKTFPLPGFKALQATSELALEAIKELKSLATIGGRGERGTASRISGDYPAPWYFDLNEIFMKFCLNQVRRSFKPTSVRIATHYILVGNSTSMSIHLMLSNLNFQKVGHGWQSTS